MQSVVFALPGTEGFAGAVHALARYYAPLGHVATETHAVAGGTVGWIAFDAAEHARLQAQARGGRLSWGETAEEGSGAAFDWRRGPLRADAHGLITTLYRCDDVHATHAVAAAWLARRRRPRVRLDLVPELVLHEFVLGFESLVEGAAPVVPAWPAQDPGDPLEALLHTLARRVRGSGRPFLGLTGGLDSLVVAAALRHLDIPARTFTWSHHESDAAGAAAVAAALDLPHERCAPEWMDDEPGLRRMLADVRWSEGQARLTPFGRVTWPQGMSAFVTGGGGEIGRAFYYRLEAGNHRTPDVSRLVRLFRIPERLPHAPHVQLERRLEQELAALPGEGWRRLDHFYARRRVARWGRAMLGRMPVPTVAAFAAPAVAAALIELPLRERTADGFHRRALRELGAEDLLPAAAAQQRRGIPRPLRLAAAMARRRRRPASPQRWAYADELARRPLYAEWLQDAIGHAADEPWARALRDGVARGEHDPVMQALLATAPVALEQALRDLPEKL